MEYKPVDLSVEEHGKGIPLVLLHGFPLNRTIWNPIIPLLKDKARLILPDLRGYGQSPDGDEIHSMRILAMDVAEMLDRMNIDKAIVCGHSMGGYAALAFAYAYPSRLSGLALVASQAEADTPERRQARYITAREVRRRGIKYIADGMPSKLTQDEAIQKLLQEIIASCPVKSVEFSLKGMAERPDASDWLGKIKVPLVAIAGQDDQLIPLERSHTLARLVNKGWVVEVPGAGHVPMMEKPDIVAQALAQLICAAASC